MIHQVPCKKKKLTFKIVTDKPWAACPGCGDTVILPKEK